MKYIVSLLLSLLFLIPAVSLAQFDQEDVRIIIAPTLPGPNQTVDLSIQSFIVDLDRSQITWTIDGATKERGVGIKDTSFTTGAIGKNHRITVFVETQSSGSITKSISIRPASVDLLWQATDSYTPPFYKGKALNAHDSGVVIQAYPNFVNTAGNLINPKSLIYNWKVNNKPQQSASGFGKDTFSFPGPTLYRDAFVTVEVESTDATYRAKRSINMQAQTPKLLFYAENELYGEQLLNPIVNGFYSLEQDEVVIRAEPFFFSDISDRTDVNYDWRVNGQSIISIGDRNELVLRKPETGSGESRISLEIKHLGKLLQFARESFTAIFTESSSNSGSVTEDSGFFTN